jgi:hypothetical protein
MPPSLWRCDSRHWKEISCTDSRGGAVAYASATQTLWACVEGQWTEVQLPQGPQGPVGPSGPQGDAGAESLVVTTPEPPGANCLAGGIRVDVGVDTNGDGVLEPNEIQHTSYVCNGPSTSMGPCTPNDFRCNGVQPQQCDGTMQWEDVGPSCATLAQACVSGACVGVCAPASTQCSGSGAVQTCSANGEWGPPAACTTGVAHATASCSGGVCTGFACDAGFTQCGNSCLDLQTGSNNCGACGRSCQGGACTAGLCPAVTLASLPWLPGGIALDASNVYWTQLDNTGKAGSVWQIPTGGGTPVLLASGLHHPSGIAVDSGNVYWVNQGFNVGDGSVMTVPIGGGVPITLASGLGSPDEVSVAASAVYWTDRDKSNTDSGLVLSVPAGGGAITTVATGQQEPLSVVAVPEVLYLPIGGKLVATEITNVYFSNYSGDSVENVLGLGGPSTLFAGTGTLGVVSDIAVDATNVYFGAIDCNGCGGSLRSVPVGGGAPVALATGLGSPYGVAVDTSSVYVTSLVSLTQQLVQKVPLAGGAPLTIASSPSQAQIPFRNVVVDSTSVYWLTESAVMKVVK